MSTTFNNTRIATAGGSDALVLAGRVLASIIFILGGWTKLMAMAGTKAYFAKIGVPLPEIAYWVAVVVELGGGLLFLLGLQTRLLGIMLAVFCIATALLAHANFAEPSQQINFMKNVCMAGGFLAFAAFGGGALSLDYALGRRSAAA
jgi:putative oxidoreductase